MVLVTNNWRMWAAGMIGSLVIFAILFFAVIAPSTNTANQAIKTGLQQSQQVINQAKQQLQSAAGQAAAGQAAAGQAAAGQAGVASSQVSSAAAAGQQALSAAANLTSCVASAGTDASKLAACQAKYGH